MAVLREQPVWVAPIYSIERHDPIMGGEYGVFNVQPRQLAWRTQYLRSFMAMDHMPDGTHCLTERAIADLAGIVESKLHLSRTTQSIDEELQHLDEVLKGIKQGLDESSGAMGTPLRAIYDALLMAWEYGYARYAFELFTDNFSLRNAFREVKVIETIKGDDSIDFEDTATIVPDETYLLIDRENGWSQRVTVKQILTEHRALMYEIVEHSSNDTAVITKNAWEQAGNRAHAAPGTSYFTIMTTLLDGIEQGCLVISHTADVQFDVWYRSNKVAPTGWTKLSCTKHYFNEKSSLYRSFYDVEGGHLEFFITALGNTEIDHIVLMSTTTGTLPSTVRTPVVLSSDFKVVRFGALYDAKHTGTEIQFSPDNYFADGTTVLKLGPKEVTEDPEWGFETEALEFNPVEPGHGIWWRIRFSADDGLFSLWSKSSYYSVPAPEPEPEPDSNPDPDPDPDPNPDPSQDQDPDNDQE